MNSAVVKEHFKNPIIKSDGKNLVATCKHCCGVHISGNISSSSNFLKHLKIWKPNEDVIQRLSRLEDKLETTEINLDRDMANIRNQISNEILEAINATHRFEKLLLEVKLVDQKFNMTIQDLHHKMKIGKMENEKIQEIMENLKMFKALPHLANMSDMAWKTPDGGLQLLQQTKKGISDLKAEWLLIRRQFYSLQSESNQFKTSVQSIDEDMLRVKNGIEFLKAESARLKTNQDSIAASSDKRTRAESRSGEHSLSLMQSQLAELRTMLSYVEHELGRLRQNNVDVRKELLISALANKQISKDDLNRIVDIISTEKNATKPEQTPYKDDALVFADCHAAFQSGHRMSGVYKIKALGWSEAEDVLCEMTEEAGWTIFQRRVDGTISFLRSWNIYKHGFGNVYGEHWMGNEKLHLLTSQYDYQLRVDLWDFEGGNTHAIYSGFRIEAEENKYRLRVQGYYGNSGDSLGYNDGMFFSTPDSDNDLHAKNCARELHSAWWFNKCSYSNLNGRYHEAGKYGDGFTEGLDHVTNALNVDTGGQPADGVVWYTVRNTEYYSFRKVEMKVKPN